MKRFSVLAIALFLSLSACTKIEPLPAVSPEGTDEEAGLPANPTAPGMTEPPWEIIEPAGPPPEYPDVDLAADWPENAITTGQTAYQQTFGSGGRTTLTADGVFPQTGNTAIDQFYMTARNDFERLSESRAEQAAEDSLPYQLIAGFTVEVNAGGILSVSREVYQFTGGAHGGTAVYCETFSVATGRLLALDDFFTVGREGYTARLLEFVSHAIDQDPVRFSPEAKQLARELFPYDTFVITPDGISLIFPEYNIAPYSSGTIRIDVPWGGVADMFALPG
jgi:hypothetical protein